MARIPRRLAGIGATDLADATAFDAYVGPAREVTVDPARGILALHDGTTAGGKQIFQGGGGDSGVLNVKNYGATGDGTTDDTTAIQAAIDEATYKVVYFPAGQYVTSPLTCGADVTLRGDGLLDSQLILKAGSTGAIITADNATHFTVQDLGFSGDHTNNPLGTYCIHVTGAETGGNGVWFDRCGFFLAKSIGLYIEGTYTKARIADCIAEGCQLDGIVTLSTSSIIRGNRCIQNGRFGILSLGDYNQIVGNTCNGNGQLVTSGAGIGAIDSNNVIMANNSCVANGTGTFFAHGLQFNNCNNSVYSGNVSIGNNGSGLDVYSSQHCSVVGNQSLGNHLRGIEVDTNSDFATVSNNIVKDNYEVGISLFNSYTAIITNNQVIGNGTLGTITNPLLGVGNSPYGIALWGASKYGNYSIIMGNYINGNVGSGSNGIGLFIHASTTSLNVSSNYFGGNTESIEAISANCIVFSDNIEPPGVITL